MSSDIDNYKNENIESFYTNLISNALKEVDKKITDKSKKTKSLEGMGTTIVMILFPSYKTNQFYIANVGDSRAYLIERKNNSIVQLSKDHTVIEDMVQNNRISRKEARTHRLKHILTHSLGSTSDFSFDYESNITRHQLKEDDYLLLCSDGLTDMIEDEEIKSIILHRPDQYDVKFVNETKERNEHDLKVTCNALIENANEKGGRDNISIILVQNI